MDEDTPESDIQLKKNTAEVTGNFADEDSNITARPQTVINHRQQMPANKKQAIRAAKAGLNEAQQRQVCPHRKSQRALDSKRVEAAGHRPSVAGK